ncbi:hypothetical protein [Bacteroides pyogenes]|uniref:hypothetical protein n=1 Tax=Bacteroides pyogenes TaxID=310300 RepID=UPI001F3ADCF2|nr:hypothetical protein [Bacteroides pyogenes]
MKIRLYILFSVFFFLQCDLKAESNDKNFEYDWVNHPTYLYQNIIIDTTSTSHTLFLETLGEKKEL